MGAFFTAIKDTKEVRVYVILEIILIVSVLSFLLFVSECIKRFSKNLGFIKGPEPNVYVYVLQLCVVVLGGGYLLVEYMKIWPKDSCFMFCLPI